MRKSEDGCLATIIGYIIGLYIGITIGIMETTIMGYRGGCQNHGPFLDLYYNAAPSI